MVLSCNIKLSSQIIGLLKQWYPPKIADHMGPPNHSSHPVVMVIGDLPFERSRAELLSRPGDAQPVDGTQQ